MAMLSALRDIMVIAIKKYKESLQLEDESSSNITEASHDFKSKISDLIITRGDYEDEY